LYVVNMPRAKHPKPEVEAALREAGCEESIWSTPETQATTLSGCAPQSETVHIPRRRVTDEDV